MGQLRIFSDFALSLDVDAIPSDVLDYSKIVFLDTLVCGIAAARLDRSKIIRRVIRRLEGKQESTVFGLTRRVGAANAAYANAEMMNALDADETFFNAAHFSAIVTAAALAEAERVACRGVDLLCGFLGGFEINARMNLASKMMVFDDNEFRWSSVIGNGSDAFGAAVAAGYINKFTSAQMTNALGIVSWTTPTPKNPDMANRKEFNSFKYAPYGAVAQAGVMASLLAEEGYIGDHDVLDIIPGFFEAQGYMGAYGELLECKADKWWILDTALKPYPSCRFTHAAIDAVLLFQKEHGIGIDNIQHIGIRLNPVAYSTYFFRNSAPAITLDHRAPLHGAFNIPYIVALALLGRRRGPEWYSSDNLQDESVWLLAKKISTAPDEELAEKWRDDVLHSSIHRPRFNRALISILLDDGRRYDISSDFNQGDPWSPETRADWNWVKNKMHDFLADIIPLSQQENLLSTVMNLEAVENVREQISPLLEVTS